MIEYYVNHPIIAERAESFEANGEKYRGGTITASPLRHFVNIYMNYERKENSDKNLEHFAAPQGKPLL